MRTLVWVDRQGHEEPINAPPRNYLYPRLSPDGTRVALDIRDQENDIWVWDFAHGTLTRVTFDPGFDTNPVWTRDGRRLIFTSERGGARNLFWQAADNTGSVERLSQSANTQLPTSVSPDGTRVVFEANATSSDLMMLTLDKDHRVSALVQTPFNESNGEISPDGRWLAYQSNDSGQFQVYVRPFPDVNGGHWQISTGGGTKPLWARNGQELFYLAPGGALMSVRVGEPSNALGRRGRPATPRRCSMGDARERRAHLCDVSSDGRRFLMIKPTAGSGQTPALQSLVVVQNWFEELKRLVPPTR